MTDVSDLSTGKTSSEGVKMPLLMPSTNRVITHEKAKGKPPVEMYLTILGRDSGTFKRVMAQAQHRAGNQKPNHSPSDDELEAAIETDCKALAQITVGGLVFFNGKWVDITTDNAYELYFTVEAFREQALAFALNRANFIKG